MSGTDDFADSNIRFTILVYFIWKIINWPDEIRTHELWIHFQHINTKLHLCVHGYSASLKLVSYEFEKFIGFGLKI
jgi:hypothetical protein